MGPTSAGIERDGCKKAARSRGWKAGCSEGSVNTLKTGILMAGLTALLLAIGYWIGKTSGMLWALVIAAGMNFFSYWYSDKMVLAMTQAQEVGPDQAPQLYAMVKRLTERAGLPMPRLYVAPDPTPN